jgi:hypothetical protein
MRKLLPTLCCLLLMSGLTLAGEVTLVKFDKDSKELTVKEGDDSKTYKLTPKTKFSAVDKKSGESIVLTYDDAVKGLGNAKAEGKLKFDITVKDGEVVEAKLPGRKKKN